MKNMKKFLLALFLLLALSGAAFAWCAKRADCDFRLVNKTGKTITNVYLRPSKYYDWYAEDELNDAPLRNGEFIEITFLSRAEHRALQDLRVDFRDGTSDEWYGLDLYHIYEMTLEKGGATSYLVAN